jgi:hypothetical protein
VASAPASIAALGREASSRDESERKHRETEYEQNCGWFSHYGDSFVCGRVRHARF